MEISEDDCRIYWLTLEYRSIVSVANARLGSNKENEWSNELSIDVVLKGNVIYTM